MSASPLIIPAAPVETAGGCEDVQRETDRKEKLVETERISALMSVDVEFEHVVLFRSLQYSFDSANPLPVVDLAGEADPTAESWTTFIGPTVGSATAAAAAEDVIRRREQAFEELRLQGDGPDIGARMDFGRELGRISRFREHSHFAAICDYMEARVEAGDHDAVKRCLGCL